MIKCSMKERERDRIDEMMMAVIENTCGVKQKTVGLKANTEFSLMSKRSKDISVKKAASTSIISLCIFKAHPSCL